MMAKHSSNLEQKWDDDARVGVSNGDLIPQKLSGHGLRAQKKVHVNSNGAATIRNASVDMPEQGKARKRAVAATGGSGGSSDATERRLLKY